MAGEARARGADGTGVVGVSSTCLGEEAGLTREFVGLGRAPRMSWMGLSEASQEGRTCRRSVSSRVYVGGEARLWERGMKLCGWHAS